MSVQDYKSKKLMSRRGGLLSSVVSVTFFPRAPSFLFCLVAVSSNHPIAVIGFLQRIEMGPRHPSAKKM